MKRTQVYWIAGFFSLFLFASDASAQTKLRILGIMDYAAAGVGESIKNDASRLQQWYLSVFESDTFPNLKGKSTVHYLGTDGLAITPDTVRAYFKNAPIQPDESLMVFYSGHGGMDYRRFPMGQYLSLSGGDMSEAEIIEIAQAPLTLLFLNACSSLPVAMPDKPEMGAGQREDWTPFEKLVGRLFLEPVGVLILRAASEGQTAWGNTDGSYFGLEVMKELAPYSLYRHANDPNPWSAVLSSITLGTQERFQAAKRAFAQSSPPATASSILSAKDQRPWAHLSIHAPTVSGIDYVAYYPAQLNPQTGKYERRISFKYWVSGRGGQSLQARAYFYESENKPLQRADAGGVSRYIATQAQDIAVTNPQGAWGYTYLKDDLENLPQNYLVKIHLMQAADAVAESSFTHFATK
jgi:hypothetical protein